MHQFYYVIQAKADDLGNRVWNIFPNSGPHLRWSFKDIALTDEETILSRVIWSLLALFLLMFGGVVLMFFYMLPR